MDSLDLRTNRSLAGLSDMLQRISAMDEPQDIQNAFARTMGNYSRIDAYVSVSVRGLRAGEYKITRRLLSKEARLRSNANPWRDWDDIPTHTGGFIAENIATPTPKLHPDLHLTGDPALGDDLAPFRSVMVVPLFDEGRALNWSIGMREAPNSFTEADVEELMLRGNLIGRMTRNLIVRKEVEKLNEERRRQIDMIARIQQSLLPQDLPETAGLTIATSYLPSNEAGGDYYDFFHMGDGKVGVLIADVSGHGAGAAVVVAMLQTILHDFPDRSCGPAVMLDHANRRLVDKRIDGSFATAFFAVFDEARRSLTFSNAGHNRPLIRRADGRIETVEGAASLPLGITTEVGYESGTLALGEGDTLILYTDGITEARAPGERLDMFGAEGLVASLEECSGEPDCVIQSIHGALYRHTGLRTRDDDQTIVAVRVSGDR